MPKRQLHNAESESEQVGKRTATALGVLALERVDQLDVAGDGGVLAQTCAGARRYPRRLG